MEQAASARRWALPSMGDVWGGLAGLLVALPSAIAFGVLVFSAIDPALAGQGALYGMMGAAAMGLVAPLAGGTAGLVSAPCAPAAAVLSGLAALLLAQGVPPERIPGLLIVTGLLSAGFQVIYGLVRGGRFIKYIPYPVVSGYLSGVGLIIALGQLPRLFGLDGEQGLIEGLFSPQAWRWPGLVVGLVTILAMVLGPRVTTRLPAAVLGLICGVATYFLLGLVLPDLLTLEGNRLVIGPLGSDTGLVESLSAQAQGLLALQISDIELVVFSALALSALLSIDTLKTCVVLDALTRRRHNSNRELLGQGIANVAAFAVGGMPGAGTMGPTLVNVTSGGRTRASVLRSRATLAGVSSKTRRLEAERAELNAHGEEAEIVALQGNLFFGTTDQLFTELERDLARRTWLLLDMRRVQSLDYTAANLFRQMHARLEEKGGGLLLCGLPARLTHRQDIRSYLARIGLVGDKGTIRVFDTRDGALEWMEDRILERAGLGAADDPARDLGESALLQAMDEDSIAVLRSWVEERQVAAGQAVFRCGDTGDEIFMLSSGTVRILLPLPGGAQHHVATFGRGDFFGDMAFLDGGTRSADAIARTDCTLYVLSRAVFDRHAGDHPRLAARLFARLAHVACERLRQADAELTALEDR